MTAGKLRELRDGSGTELLRERDGTGIEIFKIWGSLSKKICKSLFQNEITFDYLISVKILKINVILINCYLQSLTEVLE